MSQNNHRSKPTPRGLRLEALEVRDLMAAGVAVSFAPAARALTITGTERADVVSITQDDARQSLTVVTSSSAGSSSSPARQTYQFRSDLVARVSVSLGGGDDRFSYQTTGAVRFGKAMEVVLGAGDDTATVRWADDRGVSRAALSLAVQGGAGSDAVGVRLGRVVAPVATTLRANLGDGDDGLAVQALNPAAAGATLAVQAIGGAGNDDLQYFGSGPLARGASAAVNLDGQSGDDTLTLDNQGLLDGPLTASVSGGAGADQVGVSATEGGGAGSLAIRVLGGAGDDTAVIDVRPAANRSKYTVRATLDGGAGSDIALTPAGVALQSVETAGAVTPQTRPGPSEPFYPALKTSALIAAGTGRRIEYWTAGQSAAPDSPVMVLIAGGGGSVDSWLPVAEGLSRLGVQVVAVNKPGFGRTDMVAQYTTVAVVNDIREVLSQIAPGRKVLLVGHSLGGTYANMYARLHPEEVSGVVFADGTPMFRVSPGDFGPRSPLLRVYSAGARAEYTALAELVNAPLDAPPFPAGVPVIELAQDLAEPDYLAGVQELADLGQPGSLRVVRDAGHFIQADQPNAVVSAVGDMIRLAKESDARRFISGVLADAVAKYGVPGMTAAAVIGTRVVTGAAGVRQAGASDAVRAGDPFGNGSTTKAMTATLAGVLVEKGLIRWDSTVGQVFPELRGKVRPELEMATLETFLHHRSGLISGSSEDASPALLARVESLEGLPADVARREVLEALLNEPLAVPAGQFSYSNAGYAVAAAMLERVTGKPYEQLMVRYVFGPLGMSSAVFGPPPAGTTQALPTGTDPTTGKAVPFDSGLYANSAPSILYPAGTGLRMNVADWAKFARAQLGQRVNGVRLLRPETLERLHRPDPRPVVPGVDGLGYASGWATLPADWLGRDPRRGPSLVHDGSDNLWLAKVELYPDAQFGVLVMANSAVGRDGKDLEATAFAEVMARLTEHFAPA